MIIVVINILIEEFSIAAPVVSVIGLCDAILYKAAVLVFKLHLMTQISTNILYKAAVLVFKLHLMTQIPTNILCKAAVLVFK